MKTFVINLDKNVARMQLIDSRLKELGIDYERCSAVYGAELSESVKKEKSNRFAWWCLKGRSMRDGELGCALSHVGIYQKMVDCDIRVAMILEDDAKLYDCFPKVLEYLEEKIDANLPMLVLLSNHTSKKFESFGIHQIENSYFSEGYVLSKKAAERLLKVNYPVRTPADSWGYWRKKGYIDLYQMSPESCNQAWEENGYVSDVTPDNGVLEDVSRMSVPRKIMWKIKRAIGLSIANLIFR